MPADLTLRVLDIPGLQRRCVPVYESGVSGIEGCRGLLAPRVSNSAECVVRWEDRAAGMETGITGGTAVDMTHPFGRFHALLWLRERGHDLRWAEDETKVLAWSVLSVARGGDVIRAIDDVPRFVNTRCSLAQFAGASFWWTATAEDRDFFVGPDCKHHGWYYAGMFGPETGDDAIRIVCGHALADRCALRSDDGTLTLPPLPEVPRGA